MLIFCLCTISTSHLGQQDHYCLPLAFKAHAPQSPLVYFEYEEIIIGSLKKSNIRALSLDWEGTATLVL